MCKGGKGGKGRREGGGRVVKGDQKGGGKRGKERYVHC